jgi:hypothetical protein
MRYTARLWELLNGCVLRPRGSAAEHGADHPDASECPHCAESRRDASARDLKLETVGPFPRRWLSLRDPGRTIGDSLRLAYGAPPRDADSTGDARRRYLRAPSVLFLSRATAAFEAANLGGSASPLRLLRTCVPARRSSRTRAVHRQRQFERQPNVCGIH